MFECMCCIFGFNCIFFSLTHLFVYVPPVSPGLDGNQIAVVQSGKPPAPRWKVMAASGNDCVPSRQTFTLADEQNIKFDRGGGGVLFFPPRDPKILHVHSHTVNLFSQRWSGHFCGGKKRVFPEWQGDSYNYWVILGLGTFKTNLWQMLDIWFIISIHLQLACLWLTHPTTLEWNWKNLKLLCESIHLSDFQSDT